MQHIETVVVGSGGAASINFMAVGDIPSEYTDLVLKLSLDSLGSTIAGTITFNTSGGTYTRRRLQGSGSTVISDTAALDFICNANGQTASTFGNAEIYIPNYRSSVAKSYSSDSVTENNATQSWQTLIAGLWSGTDPITSITITPLDSSWAEFSSASLYGITAGSDGIVSVS